MIRVDITSLTSDRRIVSIINAVTFVYLIDDNAAVRWSSVH
jgi:hypothetical protein